MANLTIPLDDAQVNRVRAAFDAAYPGRAQAGKTAAQWVLDKIKEYIREVVRSQEARTAAEAAREAACAAVDSATF